MRVIKSDRGARREISECVRSAEGNSSGMVSAKLPWGADSPLSPNQVELVVHVVTVTV
jgi:hypothetical protein